MFDKSPEAIARSLLGYPEGDPILMEELHWRWSELCGALVQGDADPEDFARLHGVLEGWGYDPLRNEALHRECQLPLRQRGAVVDIIV
ncbi:MAG TPA: hypothetical protein VJH21_02985 [Candidatus Paceibacterota bacterium]